MTKAKTHDLGSVLPMLEIVRDTTYEPNTKCPGYLVRFRFYGVFFAPIFFWCRVSHWLAWDSYQFSFLSFPECTVTGVNMPVWLVQYWLVGFWSFYKMLILSLEILHCHSREVTEMALHFVLLSTSTYFFASTNINLYSLLTFHFFSIHMFL